MNLTIPLRSELLKTKRTASWYFVVIIAVAVSALFVLTVCSNNPSHNVNPWTGIFTEEFKSLNLLVLPMITILIGTLLPQIEYKNNTWKQLLTSPQTLIQVYFSKFLIMQLFLLLFLFLFLLCSALSSLFIGMAKSSLHLFDRAPDWQFLAQSSVRTYLAILSVSIIQFILGLTMKNFIGPVATGFILWMLGNLLLFEMHSSLANYFPYSFSAMAVFPRYGASFPMVEIISVGLSVFCLAVGYLFFAMKRSG